MPVVIHETLKLGLQNFLSTLSLIDFDWKKFLKWDIFKIVSNLAKVWYDQSGILTIVVFFFMYVISSKLKVWILFLNLDSTVIYLRKMFFSCMSKCILWKRWIQSRECLQATDKTTLYYFLIFYDRHILVDLESLYFV